MIPAPNYTQTPNVVFDVLMRDLNESELRVFLAIIRKTFGWGKLRDRISLSQIEAMTGLSRQAVINGIYGKHNAKTDKMESVGLIGLKLVSVFESKLGNEYLVNVVDQDGSSVVNHVDQGSQPSGPVVVNHVDTQKTSSKETIQKKIDIAELALQYLNQKTGSRFSSHKGTGLSTLIAQGKTLDTIKAVIDRKVAEWWGTEQAQYLTPSTLFRQSNFEKYENALRFPASRPFNKTAPQKKTQFGFDTFDPNREMPDEIRM